MTIRESIRSQRDKLKGKSFCEHISYFWDYFGIKTIGLLAVISLLIFLVIELNTQKNPGYIGMFFGITEQTSSEAYLEDFAQFAGLDIENDYVVINLSPSISLTSSITEEVYQTIEKFTTMASAKMVDNIAADTELFLYFSYLGLTSDLRNVFTEVQISSLADKIYYIDGVLLQQYQNKESTIAFEDFPDPQHPEAMIDPIPVGIDISIATEAFQKVYTLHGTRAVIGICSTSERPETAFSFLLFSLGLS